MDASDYKKEDTGEVQAFAFSSWIDSPSVDDRLDYSFLDEYAISTRDHSTENIALRNNGERANDRNNLRDLYEPPIADDYRRSIHTGTLSFKQIVSTLNHRYPIRERDESKIFGSAWVDIDDSGDYDPNATEAKTERLKWRMRMPTLDYGEIEDDFDSEGLEIKHSRPKTSTYEQGRRTGRSMMVILRFGPERREEFKKLADSYIPETEDEHGGFEDQASNLSLGIRTRSQIRSADNSQRYLIPISPFSPSHFLHHNLEICSHFR
jgi:hypothetical protein